MKFKVETVKWAWPSGRNGFGFFVYLKRLLSLEGAAYNKDGDSVLSVSLLQALLCLIQYLLSRICTVPKMSSSAG
ncbi:unnamed protein product [Boreogadus saida]